MVRRAAAAVWLSATALAAAPAYGQSLRPRSTDYVTVAGLDDVRAAWVNPASLAGVLEASIMAEVVADRGPSSGLGLAQYTLGMNSRGLSVVYARDRSGDTTAVALTRFSVGLAIPRGALGMAVTLYGADAEGEGVDLGLRYGLWPGVDLGLALRDLATPSVRGTPTTELGVLGMGVELWPEVLRLEGEASFPDALSGTLSEVRYRGAVRIGGGRRRFTVLSSVELADGRVDRWVLGLGIGAADWLGALVSASRPTGLESIERISLTGVASRRAPGRP